MLWFNSIFSFFFEACTAFSVAIVSKSFQQPTQKKPILLIYEPGKPYVLQGTPRKKKGQRVWVLADQKDTSTAQREECMPTECPTHAAAGRPKVNGGQDRQVGFWGPLKATKAKATDLLGGL